MDVSRCSHANQRQGNVPKSVLQLDLLLFFTILVKGTQRLFSVKYLFGEANFAQNFLSLGKKFLDDCSWRRPKQTNEKRNFEGRVAAG